MIDGEVFTVIGVNKEKFEATDGYYNDRPYAAVFSVHFKPRALKSANQPVYRQASTPRRPNGPTRIRSLFLRPKFTNEWDYNVYSQNDVWNRTTTTPRTMSLISAYRGDLASGRRYRL
jgi:hypothetical protein